MLTSILPSNKSNIVTERNSTNNNDSDKNNGNDSGSDNNSVNESYNAKITHTQDDPGKLVNHGTKLVLTSFYLKILTFRLRPGTATCFEFT